MCGCGSEDPEERLRTGRARSRIGSFRRGYSNAGPCPAIFHRRSVTAGLLASVSVVVASKIAAPALSAAAKSAQDSPLEATVTAPDFIWSSVSSAPVVVFQTVPAFLSLATSAPAFEVVQSALP